MPLAPTDHDIAAISGRQGDTVYFVRRRVSYMRPYVQPNDPKTSGQLTARARMKQAAALWQTLDEAQFRLWERWAEKHLATNPLSGKKYVPVVYSVFQSLTLKWLAVHQTGTPPIVPPLDEWKQPKVLVTATAAQEGIAWTVANSIPGDCVCELLLRPVKTLRVPKNVDKYRGVSYTDFNGDGSLVVTPLPPGLHAPAYRWVRVSSGEMGPIMRLPVVLVG